MQEYFIFFILLIGLEIFEVWWQKSSTLYGVLKNNYTIYQQNLFKYILYHPSFFFILYFSISIHMNFIIASIVAVKFFEVAFKLMLMQKIDLNMSIETIIPMNFKLHPLLQYLNVFLYPSLFYFSLLF